MYDPKSMDSNIFISDEEINPTYRTEIVFRFRVLNDFLNQLQEGGQPC